MLYSTSSTTTAVQAALLQKWFSSVGDMEPANHRGPDLGIGVSSIQHCFRNTPTNAEKTMK